MATFQIHEDFGNSNETASNKDAKSGRLHAAGKADNGNGKQQRQTFAVLNNLAHGRPHAQQQQQNSTLVRSKDGNCGAGKAFSSGNGNSGAGGGAVAKINDENEIPQHLVSHAVANKKANRRVAVPVDQFKAFCVFENDSTDGGDTTVRDEVDHVTDNANGSVSEMREPLQELKNELLETPVSIGDVLSPMSIDKSKCNNSIHTTDRERFFHIEEYQMNVVEYLLEAETKHLPKYGYMRKQPDIDHSMRTILIDWLVEVCEEYRLHSETLYLAVSYIDRFLSIMSVVRAKLQLVGTAAMFIASKYEEIYPPDVSEFVYITDNTYTKHQVLRMEQFILKALKFDLCVPTTYTFINMYASMTGLVDKIKFLAIYISELSLLEAEPYLQYLPSKISAAAIVLANYNVGEPMWNSQIQTIFGCTLDSLKDVILHLSSTHVATVHSTLEAMREKYKSNKYLEVSTIQPIELDEETFNVAVAKLQANGETGTSNDNNENVRKMISSLIFV